MNLKELILFGMEESQEPVIKNPILQAALREPRPMAHGGRPGYKPGGLVEPGVTHYGKNIMTGSPAQQAKNIKAQKDTWNKIGDAMWKANETGDMEYLMNLELIIQKDFLIWEYVNKA